jgi:hypothetical protein
MALKFTRNSRHYLTVPYNARLVFTTAFTIAAWVNPSSVTMQRVCSRMTSANTATEIYGLDVMANNCRLSIGKVTMGGLFGNTPTYSVDSCAGGTVPAGTWSHIAGTWDGANMRVYVNGLLVNTVARTAAMLVSSTLLSVGADYQAANSIAEYFDGGMEDLRLYNRTLSANELQTITRVRGADGIVVGMMLNLGLYEGSLNATLAAGATIKDVGPYGLNATNAVAGSSYLETYVKNRRGL